jgi:hypothetical protein
MTTATGPRDADVLCKAEGAGDESERDHRLDRVIIDAAHREKGDAAGHQAERRAASGLNQELEHKPDGVEIEMTTLCGREEDAVENHAHPVVEEALSGDDRLQPRRDADATQDGEHGNRVGRRGQRAKDQTPNEAHRNREQMKDAPDAARHQNGCQGDADGRQRKDRPLA